jgi:hypothetical protein
MQPTHDITAWEQVPNRVAALLPVVAHIKAAHVDAVKDTGLLSTSFVTWRPATNTLTVYASHEPSSETRQKYAAAMAQWSCVFQRLVPLNIAEEIVVKKAGITGIAPAFDAAQNALGGPTPLTNAIVTGLAAGGLGYGAGTLIENLFPERYLERGKLRNTLALIGGLGGVGLGANNAAANARAKNTSFLRGWTIKNSQFGVYAPELNPAIPGDSGIMAPSVNIQQFNNAVWNDARKGFYNGFENHTPPAYAAAASGMMTGLGTGLRSPIIRPADVINGIASAGVGLATATMAGKALSAMAGLTPLAQEKLQDMGLWGGMMHAIVPSMLGMR